MPYYPDKAADAAMELLDRLAHVGRLCDEVDGLLGCALHPYYNAFLAEHADELVQRARSTVRIATSRIKEGRSLECEIDIRLA